MGAAALLSSQVTRTGKASRPNIAGCKRTTHRADAENASLSLLDLAPPLAVAELCSGEVMLLNRLTGSGNHLRVAFDIGVAHALRLVPRENLSDDLARSAFYGSRIRSVPDLLKLHAIWDAPLLPQNPKRGSKSISRIRCPVLGDENRLHVVGLGLLIRLQGGNRPLPKDTDAGRLTCLSSVKNHDSRLVIDCRFRKRSDINGIVGKV